MSDLKYELVRGGRRKSYNPNGTTQKYFRIRALRDIPQYGVKSGDFGGYITKMVTLSHEGDCWIDGEAQVAGYVTIENNAYIGNFASVVCLLPKSSITVSGNAKIIDRATVVTYTTSSGYAPKLHTKIKDNVEISDDAWCQSVGMVTGDTKIYGNAKVYDNCEVRGTSKIYDNAVILPDTIIDSSQVFGQANISKNCYIENSVVNGNADINNQCTLRHTEITGNITLPPGEQLTHGVPDKSGIKSTDATNQLETLESKIASIVDATSTTSIPESATNPVTNEYITFLNEIKDNIAAYENDIVNLIKYPAMVDKSVPETLGMTVALKKALRLSGKPESKEFHEAVESLEQKFLIAESNALKLASTTLTEEERKKTETASKMLSMASNEASTDNEKNTSFKRAFRELEGIIAVPEKAKDVFRAKIGLAEIEA